MKPIAIGTGLLALLLTFSAAHADDDDDDHKSRRKKSGSESSVSATTPYTGNIAVVGHPGRLLASNCFQCHGTDGRNGGFDRLAGESVSEITGELREMRSKYEEDEGIMRVHALAYTDDQVRLLADYFARLSR